ncbi:MAG: hypothetical protein Q9161_005970 [Pseudevernia consocians]
MKLSILFAVVALCITGCIAPPPPIQTSVPVPVSQDPSPPRPFPAGRIVEVKDPSPPRPFPKYPLVGGNPLEEGDSSVPSRFPTDEESVVHDPSPPRPFPAGRVVDMESPSPPLEERDPSAPHKLVALQTAATDPSPPRPFPKYPLDGEKAIEQRDPLSRFPTEGEKEAADPSPPRPFPAGRIVEVKKASPSDIIERRSPSPLLRTPEGSEAEANDPSPPRPFSAGRVVEAEDSSSSDAFEPRSPAPLLRDTEGSEAEANDPSPPRPFPAGHPVDIEPRAEELPSHRGHGGYFPPSNPPVSEPTAVNIEADQMGRGYPERCPHPCPPHVFDCCWTHKLEPWNTIGRVTRDADSTPTAFASTTTSERRQPHDMIFSDLVQKLTAVNPTPTDGSPTPDGFITKPTPTHRAPCTTTLTAFDFHQPNRTGTSTVYSATVTQPRYVDCGDCKLTVTTVDIGNGPPVLTSKPTVTDPGTTTRYATQCKLHAP